MPHTAADGTRPTGALSWLTVTHAPDDDDDFIDEDVIDDDIVDAPAPKQTHSLKWGLVAVVVLAVVALVLVGVVLWGGDPGKDGLADGAGSSRNAAASGIASAGDTGPVAVIIDDPSCTAWASISGNLANTLALLGHGKWNERDQSIPAAQWNDELKKEYLAAGQVVRSAAAQTIGLVKLTPHRVMRELYEQFIAYARAFVEHIPNYTARDAALSGTAHSAASALAAICSATANGSAAARGLLVDTQTAPSKVAPPGNPTNPQRYLTGPNAICTDWQATLAKFGADTAEWRDIDPSISATYWNPQQKAINQSAGPVMISMANKLQQLGRHANNPVLQDFADLSATYRRAFVLALPTYDPTDNALANAATFVSTTVLGACAAVTPTPRSGPTG